MRWIVPCEIHSDRLLLTVTLGLALPFLAALWRVHLASQTAPTLLSPSALATESRVDDSPARPQKVAPPPIPPVRPQVTNKIPTAPALPSPPPAGPPPAALPPVNDARLFTRKQAAQLLVALKAGRLRMVMAERDAGQLQQLAEQGFYTWPPPSVPAAVPSSSTPMSPAASPGKPMPFGPPPPSNAPQGTSAPARSSLPADPAPAKSTDRLPDNAPEILPIDTPLIDFSGATLSPPPTEPAPTPGATVELAPEMMHLVTTLAARSTPTRPLNILSFLRPPYRVAGFRGNPRSMHAHGRAVDIHAYGGYAIRLDRPEECVQMTLALLRDLPPGRYRMGLPKSPYPDPIGGQSVFPAPLRQLRALLAADTSTLPSGFVGPVLSPQPPALSCGFSGAALGLYLGTGPQPWPFFPAPEAEIEQDRIAPLMQQGKPVRDAQGRIRPRRLVRFINEEYADESDVIDPRLRAALAAARARGADVYALFPDGKDHIHVDVRLTR